MWGDKTIKNGSALDRINTRKLLLKIQNDILKIHNDTMKKSNISKEKLEILIDEYLEELVLKKCLRSKEIVKSEYVNITWKDIYPKLITRLWKKICVRLFGTRGKLSWWRLLLGYKKEVVCYEDYKETECMIEIPRREIHTDIHITPIGTFYYIKINVTICKSGVEFSNIE